jgi:hypothetical protein
LRRHPPHGPRCHPKPHPPATVVTSDGATGAPPSGVSACASCDASAIISPTPAAANKNVFLIFVTLYFRSSPGAQKSAFRRETQSIAPPHRIGIRSAGFGIASGGRILF